MKLTYTPQQGQNWRDDVQAICTRRGIPFAPCAVEFNALPSVYGQGSSTLKIASGRATCRCCGSKILKGQTALQGYDNNDNSTFAALTVQIHANASDCINL